MADITVNQLTTQYFYQIPQIFMTRTERIKDSMGKVILFVKLSETKLSIYVTQKNF